MVVPALPTSRPLHQPALRAILALLVFPGVATGCSGGASLDARLETPAVALSAEEPTRMLRFVAEASTSDDVEDGRLAITVRSLENARGQVRVIVGEGPLPARASASRDDVVPCAADAAIELPHTALQGCRGFCREHFLVMLAAEGLEQGVTVELPILLEAEVLYEHAVAPAPGDFLRLTLDEDPPAPR